MIYVKLSPLSNEVVNAAQTLNSVDDDVAKLDSSSLTRYQSNPIFIWTDHIMDFYIKYQYSTINEAHMGL